MQRWLKIALVVILILVAVVVVGAVKMFGPRALLGPRKRALTARTFERTPGRLERGKYLANSTGCVYCHSPHDWSKPDEAIPPGMDGARAAASLHRSAGPRDRSEPNSR